MRLISYVVAGMLLSTFAEASALRIYPIRVTLDHQNPIVALTVSNSDTEPVSMQMQIMEWKQRDGQDHFEETRDVLANPPIFTLQPGKDQIIRLGLSKKPSNGEGSYRVFLQEIPRPKKKESSGEVLTLLRLSVPVFTSPSKVAPQLSWKMVAPGKDGFAKLLVRNEGADHVQITGLELSEAGGKAAVQQKVSLYVLPGAWREMRLPSIATLSTGKSLTLNASTDQGAMSGTVKIESDSHEKRMR